MASSMRFFSRKRLARSRCLLTSAAIRPGCLCGAFRVMGPGCARCGANRPFLTIYRKAEAGKTPATRRCGIGKGQRAAARTFVDGLRGAVICGKLNVHTAWFRATCGVPAPERWPAVNNPTGRREFLAVTDPNGSEVHTQFLHHRAYRPW